MADYIRREEALADFEACNAGKRTAFTTLMACAFRERPLKMLLLSSQIIFAVGALQNELAAVCSWERERREADAGLLSDLQASGV